MGTSWSLTLANPALVLAAETDIIVLPAISGPIDNAVILIQWQFTAIIGANGTSIEIRLYRGNSTTGVAICDIDSPKVIPADTPLFSGCYVDNAGERAEVSYTLTGAVAGATANSVLWAACIIAICL
jgi:hypothetical protein